MLSSSSSSSYSSSLKSSLNELELALLMIELVLPGTECLIPLPGRIGVDIGVNGAGISTESFLFLMRIRFFSCSGDGKDGSSQ